MGFPWEGGGGERERGREGDYSGMCRSAFSMRQGQGQGLEVGEGEGEGEEWERD